MYPAKLTEHIWSGGIDAALIQCGTDAGQIDAGRDRAAAAVARFAQLFGGDREVFLFSVSGRSEIGGNHVDHNLGRVIAAGVNMDILAVAAPRTDGVITLQSEGFPPDIVPKEALDAPDPAYFTTSRAMIAGVGRGLRDRGYAVGGFDAYTTSDIPKGSGLSSSAAFAVMVGTIFNHLYNGGSVDNMEIAKIARFAENEFFGKPCGLMDQTACAVGGMVTIDFADPNAPAVERIDFDFASAGYTVCIVNTGGSHADLGEDFAAIPREMKAVAACFGKDALRGLTVSDLLGKTGELRQACGDRALMRAIHFINEIERVKKEADALRAGDLPAFLALAMEAGNSSFRYLQNAYSPGNLRTQGISLALCITEQLLSGAPAAWRLHGGGFAGTIQAYVPTPLAAEYKEKMEAVFGEGACHMLSIRQTGAARLY